MNGTEKFFLMATIFYVHYHNLWALCAFVIKRRSLGIVTLGFITLVCFLKTFSFFLFPFSDSCGKILRPY